MASWLTSLLGGGGSKPTPVPAADGAVASYAEGGDQRRVASFSTGSSASGGRGSTGNSAGGGRGIIDDAGSGDSEIDDGGMTLEVTHSAAQGLAAATSPDREPLGEDGISELVQRFKGSSMGLQLFCSGPFDVDEFVRSEMTQMELHGLRKTIENPEKMPL